jgi:hypothetical protein
VHHQRVQVLEQVPQAPNQVLWYSHLFLVHLVIMREVNKGSISLQLCGMQAALIISGTLTDYVQAIRCPSLVRGGNAEVWFAWWLAWLMAFCRCWRRLRLHPVTDGVGGWYRGKVGRGSV